MKIIFFISSNFIISGFLEAQYFENCIPGELIVNGDRVNFRSEPNSNSTPIGKLIDGEPLIFNEIVLEEQGASWLSLNESWLKVKRVTTGESGFVFGKYVIPQEMAFLPYSDCDRIQKGNWYGIYKDGANVMVEKSIPVLKRDGEKGFKYIQSNDEKHTILICAQGSLTEGIIEGRIYGRDDGFLSIGRSAGLMRIKNNRFSLVCTGEVELNSIMQFTRINEKIFFVIEEIDGDQLHYFKQDLTECIHKFGEGGYKLIFAGDLNNDGVPEIIFSEGDNRQSLLYYFVSNRDRQLELKSIFNGFDKC